MFSFTFYFEVEQKNHHKKYTFFSSIKLLQKVLNNKQKNEKQNKINYKISLKKRGEILIYFVIKVSFNNVQSETLF